MLDKMTTNILLVEDSPSDARLLQQDLSQVQGFDSKVTWVERIEDAVAQLRDRSFAVVLLDLSLPDSTGFDTFIRIQKTAPLLPIVVLTGATDETAGVEAIRRGVQDYLVKGTADGKMVVRAIRYAIERKKAEIVTRQLNAELGQRLAEIQVVNKALKKSRQDALNLMEDALAARQLAEQAVIELHQNQKQLSKAQEIAHLGSWEIDLKNNRLSWSDEIYRIFGIKPQEFLATYEAFLEAVHPDDRTAVDEAYSGSLREGKDSYELEHRIVRKSTGEIRFVHEKCEHIKDQTGQIVRSVGMVHDITERKHMEAELVVKSRQLETLVRAQRKEITDTKETLDIETQERIRVQQELTHRQQALEAIYAMETAFDSSFESMNDQVVLSIAKILNTPFTAIYYFSENRANMGSRFCKGELTKHDRETLIPCLACLCDLFKNKKPLKSPNILDLTHCAVCFPREIIQSYVGVPILNSRGEAYGMICALDSVERAFDDYDVRLIEIFARYLAHEQTQRELENQLLRSNEMKMLGQLTSGVAHEVRNPLNGIMAIMGALSKELDDTGRFQPYLKHMQNQVNRLTTLMEELLALGRPIRDEKKENVSIVLLAQNALTSWQQSLQHGREVQLLISEDVKKDRMIRADSAKIEQMIINLLDNAQQHSEPDKQIILSLEASGFDRVHILVRDNGPGISPEILPRIFDPFFTTRKGGTGLGLSIVRHIAESHGGTITAYNNKDGSGATFEISLPFSQAVS